ncbi:hydroxymethylbilane synthase [Ornithinimicrobium faecis]|uniref:hydroxymethylbilane synthase n=1 Tax=Ornithinimicrobium faecis TaxID=2934158 RepID=UPI0021182BA1|nr:hydroxymethylbilane synthase [Ornithinimicrobium sp. HY1745]
MSDHTPDIAPSGRPLRLGTRASDLATSQSGWVADQLRALGHEVELVHVQTEGDRSSAPLTQIGGTGVFVSALREALQEGHIDFAVHSLKDLPVGEEAGLVVAAVPEREDPRDVLISRDRLTLQDLPEGAVIGTGSPRRAVQLQAAAPQTTVTGLRGNVGRRIGKVTDGTLDAIVLAAAGLRRLGRIDEASEVLEPSVMLPAPGQGALAVECRYDDRRTTRLLAQLDHAPTREAVTAERSLLGALEAGCSAPVGALATREGDELVLEAVVGTGTGTAAGTGEDTTSGTGGDTASGTGGDTASGAGILRHTVRGQTAVDVGHEMAQHFLKHLAPHGGSPFKTPAAQHSGA